MEIIYAVMWNGGVQAKPSQEDAGRFKGNSGFWRAMGPSVHSIVAMVEKKLGHAGFKMREVSTQEFDAD